MANNLQEAKEEYIKSIYINEANFDSIGKHGRISGTLYSELKRVMEAYANEKANAVLQEAYKKIFMDDAIISALGKDDMRRIKEYLSLQTKD